LAEFLISKETDRIAIMLSKLAEFMLLATECYLILLDLGRYNVVGKRMALFT